MTSPDPRAALADDWQASKYIKGPNEDGYYSAGIDVPILDIFGKPDWHHCAIEFHDKDSAKAEARRDATLVALRSPFPYSGAAELAIKIANSEASCFMLDAQQKQIVVAVLALSSRKRAVDTYLGYRDSSGNEMHCANAFCPDQTKCRQGCINPVARVSYTSVMPKDPK